LLRGLAATLAVIALTAAGCGGGDKSSSSSTTTTSAATPTATTQTKPTITPGGCIQMPTPQARNPGKHKKPSQPLPAGNWSLTVRTNCGNFTFALDLKSAPNASASLVALAKSGYFDETVFHRIAPGFVIQGGDPTATGSGGPGYTTVDKPPSGASYTRGVVAMAKTQNEPSGAGGSQFFVVTGPDAQLPPDYAVVGKITKGLDIVERIGRLGDANEQPTEPVIITAVKVSGP
jgi:peptidyl-prolyl cis-trans isomerase B (cyclophilin B)